MHDLFVHLAKPTIKFKHLLNFIKCKIKFILNICQKTISCCFNPVNYFIIFYSLCQLQKHDLGWKDMYYICFSCKPECNYFTLCYGYRYAMAVFAYEMSMHSLDTDFSKVFTCAGNEKPFTKFTQSIFHRHKCTTS